MSKLTNAGVKKLVKTGLRKMHSDGNGLYLSVAGPASASWSVKVTIKGGPRREYGIGGYPVVSLAEAREIAFEYRKLARSGVDPKHTNKSIPTFQEAAKIVYELKKEGWRHDDNRVNENAWLGRLRNHAMPIIGDMPIDQIGREHVLRILLERIQSPKTRAKVRQIMRMIFKWAQYENYIEHNPAGETIDFSLPSTPKVTEHHLALPYDKVSEVVDIVNKSGSSMATKTCFHFVILTVVRGKEARLARWDEIDLERRRWIIPARRMKESGNGEHRVPLSEAALDVLEQAKVLDEGHGLVFPSPMNPEKPLSNVTMMRALHRYEIGGITIAEMTKVHGLRSTFRDWCAESGKPRELAEAALAHKVGGVEGAYFRSDLFEQRRRVMDQWGAFVNNEQDSKVVELRDYKLA